MCALYRGTRPPSSKTSKKFRRVFGSGSYSREKTQAEHKLPLTLNELDGKPTYISPSEYLNPDPVLSFKNIDNRYSNNNMHSLNFPPSGKTISSIHSKEEKDYVIDNLKKQIEKEKEITSLMRTSLIEVQNQNHALENNNQQNKDHLNSSLRIAEAKINGYEAVVEESRKLKLELLNKKKLIEILYAQLRQNAESKGAHEGLVKINKLITVKEIKLLKIENTNLKQALKIATEEKIEAQNQAYLDRQDLLESRDIIVKLREAVKEARQSR